MYVPKQDAGMGLDWPGLASLLVKAPKLSARVSRRSGLLVSWLVALVVRLTRLDSAHVVNNWPLMP